MAFTLTIEGTVTKTPGGTPVQGITVNMYDLVGVVDSDITDSSGNYVVNHTEASETGEPHYVVAEALSPHYAEAQGPEVLHEHTSYEHNLVMAFSNNNPTKGTVGARTYTKDTGVQNRDIAIADADSGDVVSMVKTSGPSWMTVSEPNSTTGRVSFNTTGVAASSYSGGVRVADNFGGFSSIENFSITIEEGNTPPNLNNPGNKSYLNKSGSYTFDLVATDADDDDLTYSKISGQSWASVNGVTGRVTVNTNNASKGAFNHTWQAHDGISGGAQETHTITITNNTPVLTAEGNKRYLKDTGVQTDQLVASDVDNDTLTYSKTVGPSWGSVNSSSGLMSFNTNGLSDGTTNFTFRVSDGTATADTSFTVEIYTATPAPAFSMIT